MLFDLLFFYFYAVFLVSPLRAQIRPIQIQFRNLNFFFTLSQFLILISQDLLNPIFLSITLKFLIIQNLVSQAIDLYFIDRFVTSQKCQLPNDAD